MKMVLGMTCAMVLLACGSSTPAPTATPATDAPAAVDAHAGHGMAGGDHAGHTDEVEAVRRIVRDHGMAGGDHAGHTPPGGGSLKPCEQIATACHAHEGFSALAGECHTIGHGNDAARCVASHDECLAECEKAAKSGAHPHPAGGKGHAPGHH